MVSGSSPVRVLTAPVRIARDEAWKRTGQPAQPSGQPPRRRVVGLRGRPQPPAATNAGRVAPHPREHDVQSTARGTLEGGRYVGDRISEACAARGGPACLGRRGDAGGGCLRLRATLSAGLPDERDWRLVVADGTCGERGLRVSLHAAAPPKAGSSVMSLPGPGNTLRPRPGPGHARP